MLYWISSTTSTTMALIVGDALCVALMKMKKFKISDFKKLHPGGSLGLKMLEVQDIMHSEKNANCFRKCKYEIYSD